jgi:hypothetical protein
MNASHIVEITTMSELMLDVGQANELKLAFRRALWTNDDIKWLCEGNVLAEVLRMRHGRVSTTVGVEGAHFSLTVDYSLTLMQMIDAGRYDWINSDITSKRFPVQGQGKQELTAELVHFDRSISSDDAVAELDRRGLRPATITELLAFGVAYPEEQRKFPIVALGSVTEVFGRRFVPYLYRDGAGRDLYLDWLDGGWAGGCRFLAVRN